MDPADPVDFYLSYSPADDRWATWIGWQLTQAGFGVRIGAWDYQPGTSFTEFCDAGVRNAAVVVVVLSRHYPRPRHGTEWQAALRHDPRKVVMVRVEDSPVDGILPMTSLDLFGVSDDRAAADLLVRELGRVLVGRTGTPEPPAFPGSAGDGRRVPDSPPAFPPSNGDAPARRTSLTILQVRGPRFGRGYTDDGEVLSASELQYQIFGEVDRLVDSGVPTPDLVVVSGDVTEKALPSQVTQAVDFLQGLRALLRLEPDRLVVVPGRRDVSQAACRAYFHDCEATERLPVEPYFPKLRQFAGLVAGLYQGPDAPPFDEAQPWHLTPIPELRVVVAAMNSTMAISHRSDDDYGLLGQRQAVWFADQLRPFEQAGWLRVGVLHHDPTPAGRAAGRDPVLLRDADILDRLVGARLHFLLHGPAPGGTGTDLLGSGLPTVGELTVGRAQIVEVTADGLRRFAVDDLAAGGTAQRVDLQWRAAGGAFGAQPAGTAEEVPEPPPTRVTDPQGLLARVAQVCATRFDGATVRTVDVDPPHLLVTRREEGFTPQWRVGAHAGVLTRDVVEAFGAHATEPGSELVYEGAAPSQVLRDEAARIGMRLRSFVEFQGLLDLSEFIARQTARLRADRRYPPGLYVPQRFRDLDRPDLGVRDDLAGDLVEDLTTDHGRFVMLLGEFGHGKTFVLREVARRLAETAPGVIPILIDLRTLDTALSVGGLVAAHLANEGEQRIDLRAFGYMLREGRIVLLFDGFDELVSRTSFERAAEHLGMLAEAARDKAKIVIASRTQHFRSHTQVVAALREQIGVLSQRRILGVEDFTPTQIRAYLRNRFAGDERRADTRFRLLHAVQSLVDLGQNPRMLSFIADLPEERLAAAASTGNALGASGLYREVLESWLGFETDRVAGPGADAGLTTADRRRAVTALALRLWETGEAHLGLGDLAEVIDTLGGLADGELSGPQLVHAVGSGSLLVRTDDGQFGFIHRSVMEWLVADAVAAELRAGVRAPRMLERRPLSQLIVDFLCDLADPRDCRAWADGVLEAESSAPAGGRPGEAAVANARKVSTRLRIPATADLRGASLVAEDLSYRDLDGVDLTGADLTDARLVGTDLRGACLRDARLVGARLDEARLAGADLRGADVSRARLTGADLEGALVAGGNWRRAALIGTSGIPDAPELRAAAIAPGQLVEVALAPAAIGVGHGSDTEVGRLPQVLAYSLDGGMLAVGSNDGGVLVCGTATGLPLRTLAGHRDRVLAVAYGGDVLVTGSADGTARVWDAATGEPRHVLTGHRRAPWPIVLDDTAGMLATGDAAGVLRLWDLRSGRVRHELPGDGGAVVDLAWHGRTITAVHRDGAVRLWDPTDGTSLGTLDDSGPVHRAVFSPSGDLLATGGRDGAVRTWDPVSWRPVATLRGHAGGVRSLAFHPVERLLAAADSAGGVRLWDLDTGRARHVLGGHPEAVHGIAFDPAGEVLATGDSAGAMLLWSTASGRLRHALHGHTGSIWPFAFRPDGGQLAVSDDEVTTRLWDPVTAQCQHIVRGHGRQVTAVRFDATGDTLATCGNDGYVRLWEPATGRLRARLAGSADQLVKLEDAVFSPTARRLATVSNDGRLNLVDARSGRDERHIDVGSAPVWAVAFGPSGDLVATANDDDTVRLWDRTVGRLVHTLAEHRGRVRSIAFNTDGSLLATGCDDGQVRVWDAVAGKLVRTLSGHSDRVYAVDFAPSGLLASGSWDATARVWDLTSGQTRQELAHSGRLWTVAFDPTGQLLATAGDDLAIRLWHPASGRLQQTLTGHTGSVLSVAFRRGGGQPDADQPATGQPATGQPATGQPATGQPATGQPATGQPATGQPATGQPATGQLASGSTDGTVRLWSIEPGSARTRLTLLGLAAGWAAFTPDGRYKLEGETASQFWYAIRMCRFEIGELDAHLPEVGRLALEDEVP